MLSTIKKLVPGLAFFLPLVMFAATLDSIADQVQDILNLIVPIIMTLALIYFFIGLGKYILSAGDEEKKGEGRNIMIYGVIALFVMAAVWGLVKVISDTFGIDPTAPPVDSNTLIPR
ncbi:MAG: pilin [Patescibacteria group bacterium]